MDPKPKPNRKRYLDVLRAMTPEQRLMKAFELSQMTKDLLLAGLKHSFPGLSEDEIKKLARKRLDACHNRNW